MFWDFLYGNEICIVIFSAVTPCSHIKLKQSLTDLQRPRGLQALEAPRLPDNFHMVDGKAVSPIQWPPLLPGNIPGNDFC